ncbi:hypothetical protein [Sphingomonas oligophenolica]|uniref:Uncharacterized protein n=1 Tax=Sphingomonas oligophenolica TaxID=301154 RepID=A0A502CLL1_9SPHN|nr:hypothetical protein [Sphingomonas oligophenolica]TPG13642.1 hypothetical protein EAH84_05540 [Sphingomonas oligophenolica]
MMPHHDTGRDDVGRFARLFGRADPYRLAAVLKRRPRKRRGKDDDGHEPCPVEPNRPLDLSGGAAAALEFDT